MNGYPDPLRTRRIFLTRQYQAGIKAKSSKTSLGRPVYGGGGIMPDIFVPQDTTA